MFAQLFRVLPPFLRGRDDRRHRPLESIEADRPFTRLRYYGRDLGTRLTNRLFSRTVSALDLATTPYALRCAAEHTESIELNSTQTFATFFSPSRRAFPEFYQPLPSSWLCSKLGMSILTYEQRTLRHIVLSTSQSRSIIIDSQGGITRPHWYWWEKFVHYLDVLRWFEALDLRGTINVSFKSTGPKFRFLRCFFRNATFHDEA